MNTRAIAAEYRIGQWTGIIRERNESGLSVRAFCESAGLREHQYYYWQRKLREAAIEEFSKLRTESEIMPSTRFAEVELSSQAASTSGTSACAHGEVCVEASGVRLTASCGYPVEKLSALLREMRRPC